MDSGAAGGGASSQRELAAAHGVALRAVQKWLVDPRWIDAGFSGRAPWTAAEIGRQRVWRGQLRENPAEKPKAESRNPKRGDGAGGGDAAGRGPGGGGGGAGGDGAADGMGAAIGGDLVKLGKAKTAMQIRKLQEQVHKLEMDNAIMRKEFLPRAQVEEESAMKMRAIKTALMQIPRALRQLLADTADPLAVEETLERAHRGLINEFEKGGVT